VERGVYTGPLFLLGSDLDKMYMDFEVVFTVARSTNLTQSLSQPEGKAGATRIFLGHGQKPVVNVGERGGFKRGKQHEQSKFRMGLAKGNLTFSGVPGRSCLLPQERGGPKIAWGLTVK